MHEFGHTFGSQVFGPSYLFANGLPSLSLGDLEWLNFTVTYPPDASMEGVKMYPIE